MSGIFTGIGTGPGDPELMTLKAVKVIRACSVIALPVSDPTLEKPVYEAAGQRTEEQGNAPARIPDGIWQSAWPGRLRRARCLRSGRRTGSGCPCR